MYSPQSTYALQLAQIAGALGQQQYQWAQNTFGQLQGETADNVNNFITSANQGLDLAGNTIGQYENTYVPLQNQLVQDAGSYSSTARQNYNMGAAGSAAAQSTTAGLNAAKQNLTSMGIDPSSGMYGELEDSQKVAGAAAEAGAEQQAMINTQTTGRQLRSEAINVGQALPGAAVNSLNAANNATTGAENADLGTANVGATLMDSANPYLSTGMNLKYPPVGNTSTGMSSSMSTSQGSQGGGGGSSGGGGGSGSGMPGSGGSGGGYAGYSGPLGYPNGAPSGGGYPGIATGPDTSVSGDGGGASSDFATGGDVGAIPSPTSGGHVPINASPSMGHQTDDIPARLNANEFVIPRDVTEWKGQEFFQKLIAQSRKARMTAPAAPSKGPPVGNQPPRFASHAIPHPMHAGA